MATVPPEISMYFVDPLILWQMWYDTCCTWSKAWVVFSFAMTDYPGARAKKKDTM